MARSAYKDIKTVGSKSAGWVGNNAGFNGTGFVIAAGTVSFLGQMKMQGKVPDTTVQIVFGTAILAVAASFADDTALEQPIKWLAVLMLLTALLRYVPAFSTKKKRTK